MCTYCTQAAVEVNTARDERRNPLKITGLRTFHVEPRWLFVAIDTDNGITGWGEPIVEGQARVVERMIEDLSEYLVGQDPRRIEHHWQVMYRGAFYRGGPVLCSAISGIDQALWDITGKHFNAPVHELLGGRVRDNIRMYGHARGETAADFSAAALRAQAQGMTAIKFGLDGPVAVIDTPDYVDRQVERVAAVRATVGREFDIALDFHGRTSPAMAKRLAEKLAPLDPMFIEEPCLPENIDALVDIARSTTIPIATGERLFTKWGFRDVIERRAVSIVQPDLSHAGGISETRRIAAMAESHYISVAPHNPLGPISLAACLQIDACTPNFLIQEHPSVDDGADLGHGILRNAFSIEAGVIKVPQGPGLGIEVDEEQLASRTYPGDWASPRFTHPDGSHGDW
ncbi:galactonate dehydratase [Microbacterium marmarense]|uniref:Galactonate dehydratase n=1 Tax=Microbacterium marmarense TaxID=3122051 RepID=A0ABU8LS05_9MICO